MRPARAGLSIGVIVALAVAIWAAVSAGGDDDTTTTTTATTVTTSSTSATTSTTTTAPPTSTMTSAPVAATTDPEARVEEVRVILQDLYFGWFDAIYRNDEEAAREVVATSVYLEAFRNAVGNLDLPTQPERDQIRVVDLEILRDDEGCLVTFSRIDLSEWRGPGVETEGVNVLLPVDGTFRFGTAWTNPSDLWESDCSIEPDL